MRGGAGRASPSVEFPIVRNVARRLLAVAAAIGILGVATAGPVATIPAAHAANNLVQGFSVQTNNNPPAEYDRLARMGTNTIYLPVHWQADSPDANDVHPYAGTATDAVLLSDIEQATSRGMRVALMPMIDCTGCAGSWRGNLQPSDPHAFMANYAQKMLMHYAALSQQSGVWLMFLGSEMQYLQPYADDWRQAAADVRQLFGGKISYQPNWDRTEQVSFWDALDLVTVSAYFPLTTTPRPSVDELKRAWRSCNVPGWTGQDWVAILQRIVKATGKDLLIGEVGYRSSTTAAAHPYDELDQSQTPDQATQANAYQALIETFSAQPWWLGVMWWQWRGDDAGANDTDMTPKGKLAEQFLTQWWAEGWRPSPGSPTPHYDLSRDGSGDSSSAPGRNSSVLAARKGAVKAQPPGATSSTAAGSTTSPLTAGDPAAIDSSGLVNGDGHSAALGSKSGAHSGGGSGSRDVLVGVALVGLLGMGAGLLNLLRIRIRTPRPLI